MSGPDARFLETKAEESAPGSKSRQPGRSGRGRGRPPGRGAARGRGSGLDEDVTPAAQNIAESSSRKRPQEKAKAKSQPDVATKRRASSALSGPEGDAQPSSALHPRTSGLPPVPAPIHSEIEPGSEEDRWLRSHPIYIKMTQRGYPLPIGELELLALQEFTPRAYGGRADIEDEPTDNAAGASSAS
mmetsp:Transcript_5944/g.13080  ORF Transcript_5944/g.13080 Transcript_5944/m.13080 type:complete len:187 (+) Transcript_5944:94-654(+)